MGAQKVKRVCIVDSAYSLFLYFLISSVEEIKSTFYFVDSGIQENIRKQLPCGYYAFDKQKFMSLSPKDRIKYLRKLRLLAPFRWPFINRCHIWGHDHLWFSSVLIGYKKITVIEDGTSNYVKNRQPISVSLKTNIVYGPIWASPKFGNNPCCDKVILTGLTETEVSQNLNSVVISIDGCWKQSSIEKQNLIKLIYGITTNDEEELSKRKYILFTQCLSEDGFMSEEEKVGIYRDMLRGVNMDNVVIKVHPREKTDYTRYFPNCFVYNKKVPMQLISAIGIKFERSYTVCSTAALDFNYPIENVFLGSEIHPNIAKGYGVIRLSDYKK